LDSISFLKSPPFLEMVGNTIYTVTSVLTQRELDSHCALFNILADLRPELPDCDATIKDSPAGKIVISYCGATKTLKNWNNRFFWIDASVCPLSIPWFNVTSVIKDPLPLDDAVDFSCVKLLDYSPTLIRKYPEIFLCVIGLSRSYAETDARPIFLDSDDEGGWRDSLTLLNPRILINVKTGERTLAENEANTGKRKRKVAFAVGSLPMKKARAVGVVITEPRPVTAGKPPASMQRLIKNKIVKMTIGSAQPLTSIEVVPPVSSVQADVTLVVTEPANETRDSSVPEAEVGGPSVLENEVGTSSATPSQNYAVDDFYESQTIDSATAQDVYVPNWNVTNNARIYHPTICRNLLDHVTPPGYWVALRIQSDAGFLDSFNINSAQHVCMVSELRLRAESELRMSELRSVLSGEAKMREEFVSLQDAMTRCFEEKSAELDARIAESSECRSALGKVISLAINKGIQQGLEAGIKHGKACRSLAEVEAYDPEIENKIPHLLSALTLEGDHGDADPPPEFHKLQPVSSQVTVPVYSTLGGSRGSGSISGGMLLTDAIATLHGLAEKENMDCSHFRRWGQWLFSSVCVPS
ncbi:hypothetical protein Tco_1383650, partial [Tanacetum coccineum]